MTRTDLIGEVTSVDEVTVDRSQLRLFAKVMGLDDLRHVDLTAARAAGCPDLLVPPTFLFGLETDNVYPLLERLGIELGRVVHGGERFGFFEPIYAGETLEVTTTLEDTYEKKSGALQFVVRRSEVRRDGRVVQVFTQTLIARNDLEMGG